MYHSSKYEEHDKALNYLINEFNKVSLSLGNEVEMYFQKEENFRDDGGVIHTRTQQKFLYDFEKRHNYYDSCNKLKFSTLGQFERKIQKDEIKLSIQSCSDESCFVLAWHEDYIKEDKAYINSATQDGVGEQNAKRFTKDFVEISYAQLDVLYYIFKDAFEYNNFNKKSFSLISTPRGKYKNTPISKVDCEDLIELASRSKSEYIEAAKKELKRRCCKSRLL